MSGLRFGVLPDDALVVCVDMQRIFLEPGEWYCAEARNILPAVTALVSARPAQSLFTRFIAVDRPEDAVGAWQRYYRHWEGVTVDRLGPAPFELHPDLAKIAHGDNVLDKGTYDAFDSPVFAGYVARRAPGALVLCGVETDVCVLATVLSAVDLGHRVVLARDAMTGADPKTHEACLNLLESRFDLQIEVAGSAEILSAWAR